MQCRKTLLTIFFYRTIRYLGITLMNVLIHDMSKYHPKTHCNINLNSTLSFILDNLVPVNSSQVILSPASASISCRSQYPSVPNPLFILKLCYMLLWTVFYPSRNDSLWSIAFEPLWILSTFHTENIFMADRKYRLMKWVS